MPLTTSPVFTPTRKASSTPQRLPTPAATSLMTACMLSPHRTARAASSSCATGTPNSANTASPAYFSMLPPNRLISWLMRPKYPPLDFTHVFWVQLLGQGGKADQVAEEHRDQTALELANRRWWF